MKLIDKDALIAELKHRIRDYWSDPENEMSIYPYALKDVIKYIGTLEVKEIDLDMEIDRIWNENSDNIPPENWIEFKNIAKYFFELGLKAAQINN